MALYSLDGKPMTRMPHPREFDARCGNLSEQDSQAIVDKLNQIFDELDDGQHIVSSFIPGQDWTDTEWQPLYHACRQNVEASGMFFGQLVWHVAMQRPDEWYFYRGDKGDRDYIGMTYFRKRD